ncbi:MAG: hypothetical protein WA876_08265 [Candidatus Acidiferrales bacterium]
MSKQPRNGGAGGGREARSSNYDCFLRITAGIGFLRMTALPLKKSLEERFIQQWDNESTNGALL